MPSPIVTCAFRLEWFPWRLFINKQDEISRGEQLLHKSPSFQEGWNPKVFFSTEMIEMIDVIEVTEGIDAIDSLLTDWIMHSPLSLKYLVRHEFCFDSFSGYIRIIRIHSSTFSWSNLLTSSANCAWIDEWISAIVRWMNDGYSW